MADLNIMSATGRSSQFQGSDTVGFRQEVKVRSKKGLWLDGDERIRIR